jgi:cystathionine beta-lyase/cystathionine gamma-synthase
LKKRYSEQQVDRFVDALALFKIGFSLGRRTAYVCRTACRECVTAGLEKGQLVL